MYAYIDRPVSTLDRGAAFLLWAIRTAAGAIVEGRCLGGALSAGFARYGVEAALPSFAMAMAVLVRETDRTIEVMPSRCPRIGEDEALLLSLLGATDRDADRRVPAVIALLIEDETARTAGACAARTLALELLSAGLAPATHEGPTRP